MENDTFINLTHLVDSFGIQNDNLKDLKSECEAKNKEIKEIMAAENLDYFCTDDYKASYIIKETTKVDEIKLLQILKEQEDKFKGMGIIQTKEYVSAEDLEAAIYNGLIDKDLLCRIKECYSINKVPTLTVKKKGKK